MTNRNKFPVAIYIATPYTAHIEKSDEEWEQNPGMPLTSFDEKVMAERAQVARKLLARLIRATSPDNAIFYSPIAHNADCGLEDVPMSTWRSMEVSTLPKYDAVWVADMDGWQESVGVRHEIALALQLDMPIMLVDPQIDQCNIAPKVTETAERLSRRKSYPNGMEGF